MSSSRHRRRAVARGVCLMLAGVTSFVIAARLLLPETHFEPDPPLFTYSFHVDGVLDEAESYERSASEYWWLDSGGRLIIEDGVGKTLHGALTVTDGWRRRYAESSPVDTSDGRYPQNLFRLVTQREWEDVAISARFKVTKDNESSSANRNESNGLLLMSRYQDGDNLYYAGLRVDGHAVIKKKQDGAYTTLAERSVIEGRYNGTNLLPRGWIHLRSEIRTIGNSVEIALYMSEDGNTGWIEVLTAKDTDRPILASGHVGIRTDFMDVEFDDFRAESI